MTMPTPTAALRTGSGEPLLLLHPFSMSHHVWRGVADGLARDFEVFAPTLPAHWGGPALPARHVDVPHMADVVERMLDRAGWGTCHIAGNSLGGWVSFELARRGRARTVTAIAPAGGWVNPSTASLLLGARFLVSWPAIKLLAHVMNDRPLLRNQYLRVISRNGSAVTTEDSAQAIAAAYGCSGYLPLLWNALRGEGITGLDQVTCPVHLVLCTEDRLLPPATFGTMFRDQLPTAQVTQLPGVGHVPMLEAPELVETTIREFVEQVTGPLATSRADRAG